MEGFQDIEHFVKSLYDAIKKKIPTKVSQLTNDAGYKTTDTNTTYKLSKSGSTVTLTGSDGSTTSVTDSNTTYSSLKNPYSLDIQNNGTTVASYDGSAAKTANLTNATASSNGLMSAADKSKLDGIASSPSMLTNLGSTAAANVFQASPRPGVTGVLPIANGGTGASSLEGLRSNLDIETTLDTTCNILVDNWVQDKTSLLYSNIVSVAGVKEGYVYDIDAYKGNLTTSAEVEAYNNDFSCISGGYAEAEEGKITFTVVDKPAANITVRVKGTQVITTEETQSDEINNQKSTITDLQSKIASLEETQSDEINNQKSTITDLQSKIASLNADLAQCFFISNASTFKQIYHYGANCDRGSNTTITIDFGSDPWDNMTALIFTRYALVGLQVTVYQTGAVTNHTISNIVGEAPFSATHSDSKVILTVNRWETFEMLFTLHGNVLPTFTVS